MLIRLLLYRKLAFSQGLNSRNKYSSYEIGISNGYFLGKDLPFKTNRTFCPGFSLAIMTRQSLRVTNGIKFTMNNPTSKSFGEKDSLSDYSFTFYQTRINKFEFYLMIDLIEYRGKSQKRPDLFPYIYTGIGWIKMKQKMRYGFEDKVTIQSLTHKRYEKRSLVLPVGIGLRYKLTTYKDLSIEVIYNYTFPNQLDLD